MINVIPQLLPTQLPVMRGQSWLWMGRVFPLRMVVKIPSLYIYITFRRDSCQNRNKLWQHALAAQVCLNWTTQFEIEMHPHRHHLGHGREKTP